MSVHHVAKAAAVLIAASALAVPVIKTPDDALETQFVQILVGPDNGNPSIVSFGSVNNGCCDFVSMRVDHGCHVEDDIEAS